MGTGHDRTGRRVVDGATAVGACITLLLAGCGPDAAAHSAVAGNAVVDHIVDGDTIDVVIDGVDERIRLTGINTPEIAHRSSGSRPASSAECFGAEATEYTAALLPVGTEVRLERDVVPRDDYGRMLAYVYRASDGIFVNYEIMRHGYAQPLSIPPNVAFAGVMVQAAREAQSEGVGLWSACATVTG